LRPPDDIEAAPTGTLNATADIDWSALTPRAVRLSESVAARIEAMIVTGRLPAGRRLPAERELAERLGVSRGLAREAIQELQLKGLVVRRPGSGTHVCAPHKSGFSRVIGGYLSQAEREVTEVLDFREALEPPIAARAAERASDMDVAALQHVSDLLETETDPTRAAALDAQFHLTIAQATHNSVLVKLVETSMEALNQTRRQNLQTTERRRLSRTAHRKILAAIQVRDGDAAEAAMLEHIRGVAALVLGARQTSPHDRDGDV
jgi:GntR family transcriptional regulator, transcriptional repressor for pyruvate dehydrogenase complex